LIARLRRGERSGQAEKRAELAECIRAHRGAGF
jgi:hypothetical protein